MHGPLTRRRAASLRLPPPQAWRDHDDSFSPGPPTDGQRKSLALAAREAAEAAAEELDTVEMPGGAEDEPLLRAASLRRRDSEPDMMLRLSHDAQPANMLQRLSADSRMRSSYDADYSSYHQAPQQLSPQVCARVRRVAGN